MPSVTVRFTAALLASMAVGATALAGETVQITTPTGVTIEAEKVTSPAEGTVEHAIVTSIGLITEGKFDAWIKDWCHASMCPDDVATREGLKNYNLAAAQKNAKSCLHDDGTSLVITRRDGDPATDTEIKVFAFCGEGRMPAPATLQKDGEKWRVSSFSW